MDIVHKMQPVSINVRTSVFDFDSIDLLRCRDQSKNDESISMCNRDDMYMSYTELVNSLNNSHYTLKKVMMQAGKNISDEHPFLKVNFVTHNIDHCTHLTDMAFAESEINTSLVSTTIDSTISSRTCLFERIKSRNDGFWFELKQIKSVDEELKIKSEGLKPLKFSGDTINYLRVKNLPANNFYTFYFFFDKK